MGRGRDALAGGGAWPLLRPCPSPRLRSRLKEGAGPQRAEAEVRLVPCGTGAASGHPSPSDFSFPSPPSRHSPCSVSAAPPPQGPFSSHRSSSGRAWVSAEELNAGPALFLCSSPLATAASATAGRRS